MRGADLMVSGFVDMPYAIKHAIGSPSRLHRIS